MGDPARQSNAGPCWKVGCDRPWHQQGKPTMGRDRRQSAVRKTEA